MLFLVQFLDGVELVFFLEEDKQISSINLLVLLMWRVQFEGYFFNY